MVELKLVTDPSGRLNLRSGTRFVHSTYDPATEAARQAAGWQVGSGTLAIVIGPGLGHMLPPMLAAGATVVAVEDPRWLGANPGLPGRAVRMIPLAAVADAELDFAGQARVVFLRGPAYGFDPRYAAAETRLRQRFDLWAGETITRRAFRELWAENFLANLCELRGLVKWKKPAPGPAVAVVVSAGPSLTETIPHLKRLGVKVWAVDTAWPVLMGHGIEPELVASIDPQPKSFAHFRDYPPRRATLLTSLVAAPAVVERFDRKLFYDDGYPLNALVPAVKTSLPEFTNAGGSVSMILYQAAAHRGAKRMVMIGQDLAVGKGESHAVGTAYQTAAVETLDRFSSLEIIERGRIGKGVKRRVKGVSGEVETTPVLDQYRLWLEQFIINNKDIQFINAANYGVEIGGTTHCAITENSVINEICGSYDEISVSGTVEKQAVNGREVLVSIGGQLHNTREYDINIVPEWVALQEKIKVVLDQCR